MRFPHALSIASSAYFYSVKGVAYIERSVRISGSIEVKENVKCSTIEAATTISTPF